MSDFFKKYNSLYEKTEEDIKSALQDLGTFDTLHSGRTLGIHLMNTYKLLKKMKASNEVCLAGAFHSIYGTSIFKKSTIDPDDREKVKNLLTEDVENLVYLFSIINRPLGLETGSLLDYKTQEVIDIDENTLYNLRLLEIANLLEQKSSLTRYPTLLQIYKDILARIY